MTRAPRPPGPTLARAGAGTPHAPLRHLTIGIIGAGKMGQALIGGLRAHGVAASSIVVADANPQAVRRARQRFHVRAASDNSEVVRRADVIVLAVKPQQFPEVVGQIAASLSRRPLVISIAAGITLRWLTSRLRAVPLARVMPNLPATVGCGFSAVAFSRRATRRHRAMTRSLFGAVGSVVELPERYMDAVTAVSGSGPAYVFFLVQALEAAARSLGLPPAVASQAIRQTLEGSVRLLQESGEDAATLVSKVASKGGTTDAALKVFARRRVQAHFIEALQAAARRSQALSWRS